MDGDEIIQAGLMTLYVNRNYVRCDHLNAAHKIVYLTNVETRLLRYFMLHPETWTSNEELKTATWGPTNTIQDNTLTALIHKLRSKIEPIRSIHLIIRRNRIFYPPLATLQDLESIL